jgi:hypothetical protein
MVLSAPAVNLQLGLLLHAAPVMTALKSLHNQAGRHDLRAIVNYSSLFGIYFC